jgi:hypothetical protein
MRRNLTFRVGTVILLANLAGGCDKLGIGNEAPVADGAPAEQDLQKISYMSAADAGPKGRKLYSRFEEAKTCGDFELAMRWNRPPNIETGPFKKKMVYLTAGIPADLPKDSEVFITGKIEIWDPLTAGGAGWHLRMQDGTAAQAIETVNFWEKQEQDSQDSQDKKRVAFLKPNKPGRAFCGQAVYQGLAGKDPGQDKPIPLFSVLFAMDRDK